VDAEVEDATSSLIGFFSPEVQRILLWKDTKNMGALLFTVNLFFALVTLTCYSGLSLIFLFCQFLSALGITIHLCYMATTEDDYNTTAKTMGRKTQDLTT